MNQKLIPILQRIIAHDSVLSSFDADNLPQSAQPYLWKSYARGDTPLLSDDEQRELKSYLVWCGNPILKKTFSSDSFPDASRYYLFEDDSLLIVTNAYQQVWADARDFAVEIILPSMELSRLDAELLCAIGMDDAREIITA